MSYTKYLIAIMFASSGLANCLSFQPVTILLSSSPQRISLSSDALSAIDNQESEPSDFRQNTISNEPSGKNPARFGQTTPDSVREAYNKALLSFEANRGQTDQQVRYLSRGEGFTLFLTSGDAVMVFPGFDGGLQTAKGEMLNKAIRSSKSSILNTRSTSIHMKLIGANPDPQIIGLDELPNKVNYFIGGEPEKWQTNIPTYARVKYRDVYPGIDMIYYGSQRQLEYDFLIAPGIDIKAIRLAFEGTRRISLDTNGDLVLVTDLGEVRQHKPLVYQQSDGHKRKIAGRYVVRGGREVAIEVGEYDSSKPLIIDPVLSYSSYLGGNDRDEAFSIATDSVGNAYITGITSSTDFPTTSGIMSGSSDVFVTKVNSEGNAIIYSAYLGGSRSETGFAITVDSSGNAYLTGNTRSSDFPTANPFQSELHGLSDAFIAKLNADGSALAYSTYLGGSRTITGSTQGMETGFSIAVDSEGNAYVTGSTNSTEFPTANALQPDYSRGICSSGDVLFPCSDAFLTKLNAEGSALIFSTYLGGNSEDIGLGIGIDSPGNACVTGQTASTNFPTTPGAFQTVFGGGVTDAFAARFDSTGMVLLYSTYLGGSGDDAGNGVAVDSSGIAYLTGTTSSTNYPSSPGAFQPSLKGDIGNDAFVTKLDSAGSSLLYSTYIGGSKGESGLSIAVDKAGNACLTGQTFSGNFPIKNALQPKKRGDSSDAFVTKLNATGSALVYSTYLGGKEGDIGTGIGIDPFGNTYITGVTASTKFPVERAVQSIYGGGAFDVFVAKIAVPRITGASILGKKLLVRGDGFDDGADILINGEKQKTRNDDDAPMSLLIGRKAGKNIAPGQSVVLQVRNSDGTLSDEFPFTRPALLPVALHYQWAWRTPVLNETGVGLTSFALAP